MLCQRPGLLMNRCSHGNMWTFSIQFRVYNHPILLKRITGQSPNHPPYSVFKIQSLTLAARSLSALRGSTRHHPLDDAFPLGQNQYLGPSRRNWHALRTSFEATFVPDGIMALYTEGTNMAPAASHSIRTLAIWMSSS